MKIGFDAKRAFNNFTGLGNYSRFVIDGLATLYPDNEYFLFTPKANTKYQYPKDSKIITAKGKSLPFLWRSFSQVNDINNSNLDIYHGLSNELPLSILNAKKTKKIVTIHDLIYLRFPQLYKFADRQLYNYKYQQSCKNADKIIAISEQTATDIQDFYKTPSSKIEVFYQDCNPVFYQEIELNALLKVKKKYNLPDEYLLCVGTIEPRKNQLSILKALNLLQNKNIKLIIAGKPTAYKQELEKYITENQLNNQVQILNFVDFEDLPSLYKLAKVFIYPSVFEGFGIPLLEALNVGVPVISSKGSCFEEAGGKNSLYAEVNNTKELANCILSVWESESLRNEMIIKGLEHAKSFKKEVVLSKMMNLYIN